MTDPFLPMTEEPKFLMIGNFISWSVHDVYSADEFVLSSVFTQGNGVKTIVGAMANGLWTFTATGAFTADFAHGRVTVDVFVTRVADGEKILIRTFDVNCFSNAADRRSHARLMIDKIESVLSGRADNDVESYSINSRSITKMSVKELVDWREYYLAELGREPSNPAGGRKSKNTVKVGFLT